MCGKKLNLNFPSYEQLDQYFKYWVNCNGKQCEKLWQYYCNHPSPSLHGRSSSLSGLYFLPNALARPSCLALRASSLA
jgi:hypothetical protein